MVTTIQISPATRAKLAQLKADPRETYDEVLHKLLSLVPEGDEEGQYSRAFRIGLLNARLDVKAGHLTEHVRVKKQMGL
ncbi:MAG: hypothetical protein HY557_01505 [Euryarchaeota archaeon]|nr:hypothetical protein [Euryarchaeota archaeon]